MEANESQDVAAALNAATLVAIANLGPEVQSNSKTSGISTIIWPYSAVKGTYAFTLAEPDFRLRLKKGQVRVNFAGAAAAALGKCGLESGDEVVLSLGGGEWHAASADRRKSISGADIDWDVTFTNRLNIQVKLAATDQVKFISAAQAGQDEQPQSIPEPPAPVEPLFTPVDLPEPNVSIASSPRHKTPAKSSRIALLGNDEFESPAFIKRARASYGSLFEDGYDIFDDDGTKSRRKRARFGRGSTSWRYTSKSPSPEPETAGSPPRERSSTPAIPVETEQPSAVGLNTSPMTSSTSPMQVDDGLQTDTAEIPPAKSPAFPAEIIPVIAPTNDHGTRSGTDSLLDPSGAESMEDARPLSSNWDIPSTSYSLETEAHIPHVESHAGILPMEIPHDLPGMPHDPAHMEVGLMGHPGMFHEMGGNMPIEYHVHEEHMNGSPYPKSPLAYDHTTSDYPPLEPAESHQISSSIHYPDPSFDTTQSGPFVAPLAPNPFSQQPVPTPASDHQSPGAATSSWTSANRPTQPQAWRSRTGTSEGSTSEQPFVLDDSDNEEQSERGLQGARQAFAEDEDAEGEQEVNVEYSEDDEEILDEPEDEAGDYDTMPHPADDEDDSHDEDLQIHRLEPDFDIAESEEDSDAEDGYDEDMQDMIHADESEGEDAGAFDSQVEDEEGYTEEDEEEQSGDDHDEEDLEEEEHHSDEEAASSPLRPPQRPPQPIAPAQPVVIDLLSSSEDERPEEEDEEEDDEVEATHNRHDTQEQDEEEEENDDEGKIEAEESDEEGLEEDEMEQDDNDEDGEEEKSEEEDYDGEEIEEASSAITAPQVQEIGSVAAETSSIHDEDGAETTLAEEHNREEHEAEDESMNEDVGDRAVNLETIASQATRTSQHEYGEMLDVGLDVTAPQGERDSKENSDPLEIPPQETEIVSTSVQEPAVDETNDSIAPHPESPEAAAVEQSNQVEANDTAKDFNKLEPMETVPEPKLGDLDVSGRLFPSDGLAEPDIQPSDVQMSSPPPTQMPVTEDFVLEEKVDETCDVMMAGTEDMEVDEAGQQLPTPLDTQVETVGASQAQTELATSFESAEELHFSGVSDANEQVAVSTTTTITSQELKAAHQAPDTSTSSDISQMLPESIKIETKEIVIQSQSPTIAALSIEAIETPFIQSEDRGQADTYSVDQDYLQFNLDDELQASILEDYSQELDHETSQLEDTTFIKPQMPVLHSSPNKHRASTSARISTPPRLLQATDDFPDSDVGVQLARATQPTTSQTEASPRAQRLMARTRASGRTPSPKPATPKLPSSPTESMKSPRQAKPMQIPMESSPEVEDHSVLLARTSFPNQTSATSSVKDDSSRLEDDSESMATIKLQLARHLRDELRDCYILEGLRYHLNKTVDVIAVVMMQPAEPQRTKAREYAMSFTITDHSIGPNAVMEVQFYRPHKETLPVVRPGDIILLRRFKVMSLTNKGFGLRTQPDGSSWAVFDREGEPAQIKGPPVEYDAKESIYVDCLREWHDLLGEKARARLERANGRMIEAGSGKKK